MHVKVISQKTADGKSKFPSAVRTRFCRTCVCENGFLSLHPIDNAAFFRRTSFCSNTAGTVGTVRTIGTAGQDICAPEAGRCQTGSGKHCFPVNRKNTALYFVKILRMNYNFIIPHIFSSVNVRIAQKNIAIIVEYAVSGVTQHNFRKFCRRSDTLIFLSEFAIMNQEILCRRRAVQHMEREENACKNSGNRSIG